MPEGQSLRKPAQPTHGLVIRLCFIQSRSDYVVGRIDGCAKRGTQPPCQRRGGEREGEGQNCCDDLLSSERTLVPLLKLLLIKVSRLLELGELLLGELRLSMDD